MDEKSAPRSPATRRRVRATVAFWVTVSLVLVGIAATSGSGGAAPDLGFRQVGHWVYSGTLGRVFHVNGGTKAVDASAGVDDGRLAGGPAVQGPGEVYVPGGDGSTIVFGKSKLKVKTRLPTGVNELPVGLEPPGGPYYVYRQSGVVQRLSPLVTIRLGGSLADPVATSDGTVWLLRQTDGAVCSLARTATAVSCPDRAPAGHRGALTVLGDEPALVDLTSGEVRTLGADGLGPAMPVGTRLGDDAKVAPADAAGTLPIVRPADRTLLLVDTTELAPGRQPAPPRSVRLETGDVGTPATAGRAVAIVDRQNDTLVTYDVAGARVASTDLPAGAGVRLSRAPDGRVYADVDGTTDSAVVVDGRGRIAEVPLTEPVPGGTATPAPDDPSPPPGPGPTPSATPTPTATPSPSEQPEPSEPPDTPPSDTPPDTRPSDTPPPDPTEPTATPTGTRPAPPPPTGGPGPTGGPPTATGSAGPPRRPTVPGAPRQVTATASGTGASLSWQPGPANGGPVTAYRVSWRLASAGTVVGSSTLPGTARGTTVSGLADGETYLATVAAENAAGVGAAVESNPVTVRAAGPGTPTAVRATADGATGAVTVAWQPAPGAGATAYTVTASSGGTQRATTTQAGFPALRVGVRTTFTVAAVDARGRTGTASAASNAVTPYRPAAAPAGVQAARGDRAATLTWTAPALNGGELAGYQVAAAGVATRTVAGTTATVDGLTPGTAYSFTVRAVTREQGGTGSVPGAVSAAVAVTAATVPTVDVVSAALAGTTTTVVADVDDGGAPMASCRVLVGTEAYGGLTCAAGRRTFTVTTGAVTGAPTVTATGTNQVGTGGPGRGQPLTGGGGGTGSCAAPSDVLDLGGWSLGLPTGKTVDALDGYESDPWFVATPDCTGVQFRAAVNGETTSNSDYPRSALRDGTTFSSTEGTHTLSVRATVTQQPAGTPAVVVAQVHGARDDRATFRLEGSTLYLTKGDDVHHRAVGGGGQLDLRFVVADGRIRAYVGGALVDTIADDFSGGYFQAGAFTQANCDNSSPCSAGNYGQVVVSALSRSHTG